MSDPVNNGPAARQWGASAPSSVPAAPRTPGAAPGHHQTLPGATSGHPSTPPGAAPGYAPPPSWAAWNGTAPGAGHGALPDVAPKGAPIGLAVVSLLAMALAASIPFDDTIWWVTMTAWAVFGVLSCGILLLSAAGAFGLPRQWTISAIAAGSVIATWVLIALPSVASNAGFAATISALAAFGSLATTPGRRL